MKIKRISLYNIGPYVGINTFDFTVARDQNIVLIGGKNGAGKTTFFKAIKTCLYGCKVWGYDAPGKDYYSIISGLVNFKTMYDNMSSAYVEIDLVFDDGKQVNTYTLRREWKKVKTSLSEYFQIRKNEELILGAEEDDFVNYLLSVIPPDMFNFYFFDGESIAEFFLGADGNKNFRNAFLKLYGLDTLSIMIENFARNTKKSDSKKTGFDLFVKARDNFEKEENTLNTLVAELKEIENKIDLAQIKIKSLQVNYSKEGGIGLSEWKEISELLLKEENARDNLNRWFKEVANHYLPFIILEKNLKKLLNEINEDQERQRNKIILDTFSSKEFGLSIKQFFLDKQATNVNEKELIAFLRNVLETKHIGVQFDFSNNQINRILAQIYEKLDFDVKQIKQALSQLNSSLKKSKKLRDTLTASSIDGYEDFVEEKEKIEKELAELTVSIEKKKQEIEKQKLAYEEAWKAFLKAKESYEFILKNKSINDMSERAAAAYTLLEEKLVLRQAKLLQDEFLRCFTSIINKDNFIDGIVIDKNINIIPYKFVDVKRSQIDNYKLVNKDFLKLFDESKFIIEMNKLEFGDVDSIKLPSPIKAPFSQGERQVYIMSIYLALLKTSHKDIPFFIDTPFARIDSNHRVNIVEEFFMKLRNQMFILSTDEEIIGSYKEMIKPKISDTYLLDISDYGTTKIVPGQYFGD
jgi:DNA sulfur modification protein DndD